MSNEFEYKERDRRLKEQFINGFNYNDIMTKIITKLAVIEKTNKITREQVLSSAKRVKYRVQKSNTEYI